MQWKKRKATATKSSSRKVHEPGTEGLPETSDSDSEQAEEEDDEDQEEETLESLLQEDEESDEQLDMESDDYFEEGADGGFPGKVSKKSKKKVHKSPLSTVSTNSRKRGDWESLQRFDFIGSRRKAMKKVQKCFEEQMCLSGSSRELKTSENYKTCGGWKRNKLFIFYFFTFNFYQTACLLCH